MSIDQLVSTAAPARRTYPKRSPVTGQILGDYPATTVGEALDMVARASQAQVDWGRTSYVERRRVLLAAADRLESELEQHVLTLALEIGATRAWTEMNIRESAATLREAAALCSVSIGEVLPSFDPTVVNHSLYQPAGVTLSIVPWNAPVILAARSSAISLAVGNAVILRPSEESPESAGFLLANALLRSGLPDGVVSVLTTAPGDGPQIIDAVIAAPEVRRVVFIGSTPVGRAIAAKAGAALTPAVMELGGKNATVVRGDVDLERWAPLLAFASFAHTGQVCMCTDKVLVHRDRFDETVERLSAIADAMVVGDPRDPDTDLGPLINDAAAVRFRELVDDARGHGARVVAGGGIEGRYARPTVLVNVSEACRFHLDEGFAPIVSVAAFDDDDDAVAQANAGDLGLIASVVSADASAADRIARRLHAGAVHVNGPSIGDEPHVPFGGLGASGMGRLGGAESVRFFTEQRTFYTHSYGGDAPAA